MALDFIRKALASRDDAAILRYARLHLGDGDEVAGRADIDRAYVTAIKGLIESPATDYGTIRRFVAECDTATLAHLFLYAHLEVVRRSGTWIHDGEL
jgi:hypothetical protein